MKTIDILNKGLKKLEETSSDEVKRISKEKGIKLGLPKKEDPAFVVDLQGLFPEAINSK